MVSHGMSVNNCNVKLFKLILYTALSSSYIQKIFNVLVY